MPVVALWGLAWPAGQGLMTRRVGPSEQGALQGANGSIQGVATMIGPVLFAATFAYSIGGGARCTCRGPPTCSPRFMLACGRAAGRTRHGQER